MSSFWDVMAAVNAASAAAAVDELKQQLEEEAWEREEARQEREEEREAERWLARADRYVETDEEREKKKWWDPRTEGIRGGIEAILEHRDPRFRLKLLEWHKAGRLRSNAEIEIIDGLLKDIGDSIITEELDKILSGRYDNDWILRVFENDSDRTIVARSGRLDSLHLADVVRSGYCSRGVKARLAEVSKEYQGKKELVDQKEEKRRQKKEKEDAEWRRQDIREMAAKEEEDRLSRVKKARETEVSRLEVEAHQLEGEIGRLIKVRRYPQKLIGGVIGWYCQYFPSRAKWWIRAVCMLALPILWTPIVPAYLFLWVYVSYKSDKVISDRKRALRRAIRCKADSLTSQGT